MKNLKKYYIATQAFQGDLGKVKKGEIFSKEGVSQDDSESFFVNLANPNQEYYTDVRKDEFKKLFRPVDETKDKKTLVQLSKWHLIDYGDSYWVLSVSMGRGETFKEAITRGLKQIKEYKAESPKLALKKAGHSTGRMDDVGRGAWFSKMYADWGFIVTTEDPSKFSVTKLVNMVKKAGTIKESMISKIDLRMDKMLSESVKKTSKPMNEAVQLSLLTVVDLLPKGTVKGDSSEARAKYKALLIALATSLNQFYKENNINIQIRTK
jgi:hypothetical protein